MASMAKPAVTPTKRRLNATSENRPKRRKTAVACNECRDRKRKCDGRRPVCGACSVRIQGEQNCLWDSTDKFHNSEYMMSLQSRVRQLERMLSGNAASLTSTQSENKTMRMDLPTHEPSVLTPATPEPPPPTVTRTSSDSGPDHSQNPRSSFSLNAISPSPMSAQASTHFSRIPLHITSITRPKWSLNPGSLDTEGVGSSNKTECDLDMDEGGESDAHVDGMGAIASTSVHQASKKTGPLASERVYFGPSSTLGFMKRIQTVLQSTNSSKVLHKSRNEPLREQGKPSISARRILPTGQFGSTASRKIDVDSFSRHNFAIPTRELANSLLSSYWNYVHPIYPYIFKSAFNLQYEKLWSASNEKPSCTTFSNSMHAQGGHVDTEDYYCNEPIFFCILNLVFAFGAHYSPIVDPGERCETGRVFFQRAKQFINLDVLEYGEVTLVQALLLTGHYLQSTDKSTMCWNITGLAIRASQSIGLDKPIIHHSSDERLNKLDEELRKRLWGGCILLDRVTSMMFGRQLMISPASIRGISLPESIDEEDIMGNTFMPTLRPSTKPNYLAFFAHAVKLCQIVGEVLEAVYGGGTFSTDSRESTTPMDNPALSSAPPLIGNMKIGNLHEILRLDATLTEWRDNLPVFLQISSYPTSRTIALNSLILEKEPMLAEISQELLLIFSRQAKVLKARFLHVKILLSRPVLAALLSNVDTSPNSYSSTDGLQTVLNQPIIERISRHCVQAAQDLTFLVYDSLMYGDVTLPASWYNVFYLYTTATIFVAQRLCTSLLPTGAEEQWQHCWDKCLQGLCRYQGESIVASRCFKVLDLIDKQLFRAKGREAFSASQETTANDCHQRLDVKRGEVLDPTGDSGSLVDQNMQFPGVGNPALDAQDMEWLANMPFDPNFDIEPSTAEWLSRLSADCDTFFST